jgi:hypothetical protein
VSWRNIAITLSDRPPPQGKSEFCLRRLRLLPETLTTALHSSNSGRVATKSKIDRKAEGRRRKQEKTAAFVIGNKIPLGYIPSEMLPDGFYPWDKRVQQPQTPTQPTVKLREWKGTVTALALKVKREWDKKRVGTLNSAFVRASKIWVQPNGHRFSARSLAQSAYYDREYRKKGRLPGSK